MQSIILYLILFVTNFATDGRDIEMIVHIKIYCSNAKNSSQLLQLCGKSLMYVMGWVQIRKMFVQQSHCTGIEAADQSGGPGSDGLVSSP